MGRLGLYVHIPFCRKKCDYCDFYSEEGAGSFAGPYLKALLAQAEGYTRRLAGEQVDTVYLGGGTPSLLGASWLCDLLDGLKSLLPIAAEAEITLEANPDSADFAMLSALHQCGYNRISFGVQSFHERELAGLGRVHSVAAAKKALTDARKAGFTRISADLMFGIPGQDRASFAQSVERLLAFTPEHISAYSLKIGAGTPFARRRSQLDLPDEEEEYRMYQLLCARLAAAGYIHYEISNFAKPGAYSRHNLKYWHCEPYIGLGPGAHSYFNGERYAQQEDLAGYLAHGGRTRKDGLVSLSRYDLMSEYLIMRLRLSEGVDKRAFSAAFAADFDTLFARAREKLAGSAYVWEQGDSLRLSEAGFWVSNAIMEEFLLDLDRGLAQG